MLLQIRFRDISLCDAAEIEQKPLETVFSVDDRLDEVMKQPCLQIAK